jgi:hypothetical protein
MAGFSPPTGDARNCNAALRSELRIASKAVQKMRVAKCRTKRLHVEKKLARVPKRSGDTGRFLALRSEGLRLAEQASSIAEEALAVADEILRHLGNNEQFGRTNSVPSRQRRR